ncbi:TIGR02679 domain-containing protein [Brooklawnia sp.]|uniref:TIGR02679 domain-containing protein n=1 Tax=Brooklawnia sp. TaxID=2699740 RepID=UPI00311E071A
MIPEHVMSWAKKPGPARLLAEIRSRRERGALGPRSLIKLELTDGERREIGQMLSVRWQLSAQPLRLGELQSGLAGHGVDLDELLEACGGPLRNLRDERAAELLSKQADQSAARAILREAEPSVPDEVVTRCLVGATEWTPRAREIVRVLDATGESAERLPVLAARLFGDAHALDRSRPLGRAVARFVSGVVGDREWGGGELDDREPQPWQDPVGDSALWRQAWAARGIACDEVSSQVLVLNLPLVGEGAAVQLAAVEAEPVWLTLRSLRGSDWRLADGVAEVFVCENPSIVEAAADRFGASCRPLICTFGVPGLAAQLLLASIARRARLWVRADGDMAGWRIVESLLRLPGAQPWRMPPGFSAYEEEIVDDLLDDLAGRVGGDC